MNQPAEKTSLVSKLRERLRRAALRIAPGATMDEALFEELETQLLQADVGMEATRRLLEGLKTRAREGRLKDSVALRAALTEDIAALLVPVEIGRASCRE